MVVLVRLEGSTTYNRVLCDGGYRLMPGFSRFHVTLRSLLLAHLLSQHSPRGPLEKREREERDDRLREENTKMASD